MLPVKEQAEVLKLKSLGKIRLGEREKGEGGRDYYVPSDHFVCPDEVKKVFGDKPTELRGMLLLRPGYCPRQFFRCYTESGSLVCRGDGDTAVQIYEKEPRCASPARLKELSCNPGECFYHQRGDCRKVVTLFLFLPDCPAFGVYQLDTCSPDSVNNIYWEIAVLQGICSGVSVIRVSLEMEERVLCLNCHDSLADIQRRAKVPDAFVLPSPDNEPPDDFFPEKPVRAGIHPVPEEGILYLWARVKSKLWHFEIQESQIRNWFAKNYHIEASLLDFDQPVPPARFNAQMLCDLLQSIERHAGNK